MDLQRFFRKRSGLRPLVRAGDHGDLTWRDPSFPAVSASSLASRSSRLALMWLISLASYSAGRSGLVLHDRRRRRDAAQFRRPRWRLPGRALLPDARLLRLPAADRARRQRLALLLVPHCPTPPTRSSSAPACSSPVSRHSCRWRSARLRVANREILAGGYLGKRLAAFLADYLNKTGSIILILTLLFLSIVLSTQFSFGRLFGALFQMARDRWAGMLDGMRARQEERRREQQRQEVAQEAPREVRATRTTKEVKPARVTPRVPP